MTTALSPQLAPNFPISSSKSAIRLGQDLITMQGKMYTTAPPPQLSDSNRRIIDTDASSKRVYQAWKGSNRFFLGGRLIFGPDVRSMLFTVFLIVTPVILFCVFVSQSLVTEFQHHLGNLIVAISAVSTAYIILLLFLTSGRDPGIIPRNPHPPEPEDDASSLSTDWARSKGGASSLPPTKDILVNGMTVKVKYCHTCMLYRPPRCSHCSICDNCVERFDHHCPWVGQCIGKTTYENFRYRYDMKTNPYNLGLARNVGEIFFSKIPTSQNNFRGKVKADSSTTFTTSLSLGHVMSPEMPKTSFDIEMGGKRQAVAEEEFEAIQSQIDSVVGLERCGTQPRHMEWGNKGNWEISPDIHAMAAEFGMEHGVTVREKINGGH
ncbi:hypothetical protein HHK36_025302 [Tetracentron sinense]|uniref:S-acyltransferase n=1 Tax=Tetracentron sinense TaxID=13715 RepID=A0A834YKV8_TETSI|nr:hypothetical protein HHK36_025302 [Tetracentron sinense]